ncbi:SLBB domain-containing protein [Halomicronema sp. CCY15110]|uniref:SLBB domain-containing protein n=1 Tax=Halomicronema sp. CCY15110 TaxID=2767773 RepID=UPI00194FA452|nr:SLBB domain-containing protein [Halomicronema sp. CCY15110]
MHFLFQLRFTPSALVVMAIVASVGWHQAVNADELFDCDDSCDDVLSEFDIRPIEEPDKLEEITDSVSEYRLGPGDLLDIQILAAEEYSGEVIVTQDGSINLPQAGRVIVEGLTIQQAIAVVAARYAEFIRQPIVNIQPIRFRPVRIGIAGEVKRPGSYIVSSLDNFNESNVQDSRFPTLTQIISQAGGITADANLRAVEIRRNLGRDQATVISVDLWDLVVTGNLDQDPILLSDDEVLIPTATALSPEELALLSTASFAPDTIQVYVSGEVEEPGVLDVPLNTPLNQALLAAGGFNPRANRSYVELLRVNPNGTVVQQNVDIDFSANIAAANNPILKDQDVIVVNRSGLAQTGDITDILLSPITRVLNTILGVNRLLQ